MSENLVNASVPITLDGQDFILRYRAIAFIQYAGECKGDLLHDIRSMGASLQEYGRLLAAGEYGALAPALEKMRDILWAGLQDAQPTLTRGDCARMFGLVDFPALMPVITHAVTIALPAAGSVAVRPTKPAPRRRDSHLSSGAGSPQSAETQAASPLPSSAG
jgi:hypothetical protein